MDDMQSEYSTSQKSHAIQPPPDVDEGQSSIMNRKPMTKKELQAFMKAKLAKTKVTDSVVTGAAASGQQAKNFSNANRRDPTKRQDLVGPSRKPPVAAARKGPMATPSTYKGKGDEVESDDSADDIAAANEKMK